MNYGTILKQAWKTLWKHKIIIWVGLTIILPGLITGLAYGIFLAFFSDGFFEKLDAFFYSPTPPTPNYLYIFLGILGYLSFFVLGLLLRTFSQTTVTVGTLLAKDRTEKISFRELWEKSKPYFGRVLALLLLIGLAMFIAILVPYFITMIAAILTMGIGLLCMIPLFFLIIPLGMVGYIFISLSTPVVVVEDLSISETITRIWALLKEKFWSLILFELILYGILVGVSVIFIIPGQAVQYFYTPQMMNPSVNYYADMTEMMRTMGLVTIFVLPFSLVTQGFTLTYSDSAWLFALLDITAPEETSEEAEIQSPEKNLPEPSNDTDKEEETTEFLSPSEES